MFDLVVHSKFWHQFRSLNDTFNMANAPINDLCYAPPSASSTSPSTTLPRPHAEDINSTSYIPRMARMIPTSSTVHTFFIKKVSFPLTSRPEELWILERAQDGIETWKPIEFFLESLQISHDPMVLQTAANLWRRQFSVPTIPSSSSFATHFPVLPHPDPDVHFDRPVSVIPDHTHILQACWGRSADHHSQGTTTSLLWPPWRSVPPSSPAGPTYRTPTPTSTLAPITYAQGQSQPDQRFDDGRLVPFGEMDMSDSSV